MSISIVKSYGGLSKVGKYSICVELVRINMWLFLVTFRSLRIRIINRKVGLFGGLGLVRYV